MEEIFTKLYETCSWGSNGAKEYKGSSGWGSNFSANANTFIPFLKGFILQNQIKKVVDLGCGDFETGRIIYDDLNVKYVGYDAYKNLIDFKKNEFSAETDKYNFVHLDFFSKKEEIESGDLCILKDVLQHWSNHDVVTFLDHLVETRKFKYILIVNCSRWILEGLPPSDTRTGFFRPLSYNSYPLNRYRNIQKIFDYNTTKEISLMTFK